MQKLYVYSIKSNKRYNCIRSSLKSLPILQTIYYMRAGDICGHVCQITPLIIKHSLYCPYSYHQFDCDYIFSIPLATVLIVYTFKWQIYIVFLNKYYISNATQMNLIFKTLSKYHTIHWKKVSVYFWIANKIYLNSIFFSKY